MNHRNFRRLALAAALSFAATAAFAVKLIVFDGNP